VRCTPFASTPKSELHRRHRPVISRGTRTYSPSRTTTKHRPQNRRRVRDAALLTTPPCATWRLTQTRISARIRCARQLARPHGSTGPRPARRKDVEKHNGGALEEDARRESARRESAAEEALWQGLQHVWDLPQSRRPQRFAQESPDRDGLCANTCAPLRFLTTLGDCWSNRKPADPGTSDPTTMQFPCSPPF